MKKRFKLLSLIFAVPLLSATPLTAWAQTVSNPLQIAYTVQPGNTLYGIAQHFHVSLHQLEQANPGIKDPSRIAVGEKISIPVPSHLSGLRPVTPSATVQHAPESISHSTAVGGSTAKQSTAIIHTAYSLLGTHYRWGGTSPVTGFDCSGFIQYIFHVHGIQLPRTASEQANVGKPVSLEQLKPGDLMFFVDTYANQLSNQVTHVALYIGNGNVIESSSVHNEGVVVLRHILSDPWYKSRYYGARNVLGQ